MTDLRSALTAALAQLYPDSRIVPLVGDASARRFHRLALADGGTRVVMDYGAPFEGETDDVRLARIFEAAALPVARVMDVLPEAGAIVLEDLGDTTLESALLRRAETGPLRESAVRLAVAVAERGTPALAASPRAGGPALDAERFCFEMDFFLRHFVGDFLRREESAERLRGSLYDLARAIAAHPRTMCHRDFHSRNIMVRTDTSLAMVDIQDARWGPDTYDIASLLHDAYAEIDRPEADELFELFLHLLPASPVVDEIRVRFELVSTQRMLKALGTFGYQIAVLGRERYRSALDRTVRRLSDLLPRWGSTKSLYGDLQRTDLLST